MILDYQILCNNHVFITSRQIGVNSNLSYSSPSPVNAFPPNSQGFHDVHGNAWEWTLDYFSPLPGFEVHRLYEDFSTPCFDGLHHVIQGSSFMSTGNEASIYSRYHFRPHFLQHASFRLVEQSEDRLITSDTDAPGPYVGSYPFRRSVAGMKQSISDQATKVDLRSTLLSKHFGAAQLNFSAPNGYEAMTKLIVDEFNKAIGPNKSLTNAKVLDVGCGAGGFSLRVAPLVGRVIAFDYDNAAIELAREMHTAGRAMYHLRSEGELIDSVEVLSPGNGVKSDSVEFHCADPMCLPAELHGFDVVVLNDILDAVSSPNSVLGRLGGPRGLLSPGGLLIVASAYQWSETRTPKSLWLGGTTSKFDGSEHFIKPQEQLAKRLSGDFELISEKKLPLIWQESSADLRCKILSVAIFRRNDVN